MGPLASVLNIAWPACVLLAAAVPRWAAIPVFAFVALHFLLAWVKTTPLPDEHFGKRYE